MSEEAAASARPTHRHPLGVEGHTPQFSGEVLDLGFLLCIETNCFRGGWLTAVNIGFGQDWQTDQVGRRHRAGPASAVAVGVAPGDQ